MKRTRIIQKIINEERRLFLEKRKSALRNTNPSIISSNCNGGVVTHDLGLRFLSPTVNLWFTPDDFLKIMGNPERYLSAEPIEIESDLPYPIGKLYDIVVYFQHYSSFEEARNKWIERPKRINYDNLFFMMTERDGCSMEQIKRFDDMICKNRVIFTHLPYYQFKSAFYIKGFEDKDECGILSDYKNGFRIRRYLDDFDVVDFLNR